MSQNKTTKQPQAHIVERQMVNNYIKSIALNDTAQEAVSVKIVVV